jgi:hypothetical protein
MGIQQTPFWAKNSACYFPKIMNSILSGLTGTRSFVYLDDIVIYAKSLADHNINLRQVLHKLRIYRLKLQAEKCKFLRKEVNYQGHQIAEAGLKPDCQNGLQLRAIRHPLQ